MRKMKKVFSLIMAVSLLAATMGCKKEEETSQTVENFTFGTDELEFSWYDNSDTAAATLWADSSMIEKWILENKKVKIKYMDPGGASAEKLATMIVSDKFPDVITMLKGQDSEKLISSKKVIPLNEYFEKYPNIYNALSEKGILQMMTYKDGKNYEIPNWANITDMPTGNNAWVLNKKVYEELGSPKLEDFDDLYNYLKMVKEKYPDMIPYETTDSFQGERYVLAGMAENLPPDHLDFYSYVSEDGKLKSIFEHPAYRETAQYLNKLYREELMTRDVFSQTADQVKEKFSNGRVAVTSTAIGVCENTRKDMQNLGSDWITITPVKKDGLDREKVYSQGYNILGWTEVLISKDAKNPEGIYAFLDWLFSPEGQRLYMYGPPGYYYDEVTPEGYPILNEKWFESTEPMKDVKGNGASIGLGNSFIDKCGIYVDENSPEEFRSWGKQQQLKNIWPYAKDITEFSDVIPGVGVEEGIIYQTIMDLHKKARAEYIYADSPEKVDAIIDTLIQDTRDADIEKLLQYEEKVWNENKVKLSK